MSLILLTLTALVCIAIGARYRFGTPLPPGPRGLPFIGNLFQFPFNEPYKTYFQWSRVYGPVVYFHIFGRQFVVLNSLKVSIDLFEKRSAIYSTKPRLVMAGELVGKELNSVLFSPYGSRLKQIRQYLNSWVGKKALEKYHDLQTHGSHRLLAGLLDSPEQFAEHIRHTAGSVVLKLVYGFDCAPQNDPWIHMSEELTQITMEATQPGRWLVDSFPILRYIPAWIPGAHFKRWAAAARKKNFELVRTPYNLVKKTMLDGSMPLSWTSEALREANVQSVSPADEDAIQVAAGSVYAGGIDTTVSTLRTFVLMMARHPEIQRKAQKEIDVVVGTDRLPTMEDRDALPYICNLIKEVFRINPAAPVIPHSLDNDDVYEGYKIPKGTCVMVNTWGILHDPETYKDPDTFNPDRFNPELGEPEPDPTLYVFGVGLGRRFCPGYHFALVTVSLNIMHILSAFTIDPPLDASGKPVPPPLEFRSGHISAALPFDVLFKPRSAEKAELIKQSVADGEPTVEFN